MRIIGGYLKGHRLTPPKSDQVRPTADMVKGSIFNILRDWEGKIILDLFGGTGNLGIEAYSRGAREVVFVDNDISSIMIIRKNLMKFDLYSKSKIYSMDFRAAIKKFGKEGKKFDVIFIDPPFKKNFWEPAFKLIIQHRILQKNGIVISEIPTFKKIEISGNFELITDRNYGQNRLIILRGVK